MENKIHYMEDLFSAQVKVKFVLLKVLKWSDIFRNKIQTYFSKVYTLNLYFVQTKFLVTHIMVKIKSVKYKIL
jgi:hypothetical protein